MRKKIFLISIIFFSSLISFGQTEMLGPLTREDILKNLPDWQEITASYNPKQEAIEQLKASSQFIQVEIYLGTWCPDSQAHVSAYFKILDIVNNPLLQTTYIGVPRDKLKREPYIQGKNIIKLPTFIVLIDGQEKGRIIETPIKSVEEDLLDIINK